MCKISPSHQDSVRSKTLRSKFSVSSLLLAGAVSLVNFSGVRDAPALSGTLTSSQVVTSPRETGGAGGGATLIHTAASTTASSPDDTARSSSNGPSEEGAPATRSSGGGSRRRAQTEEGRTHRRNTTTGTARRSSGSGKVVAESKDKVVAPIIPPAEKPIFSISTGIESRYIFHGLDIIAFNSAPTARGDSKTSPIYYVGADVAFKGLHFGATYVQSFDRLRPYVSSVFFQDNSAQYYEELDFNVDYTIHVVANILDATVGYNSYVFLQSGFKGTSYQGEVLFRLAYKQIPYITPSFTYYYYASQYRNALVGNLNGSLTEFRIDGLFPVLKSSNVSVSFAPYVSSAYNVNYLKYSNSDNVGGWSYLETGIKIPITYAKHFTVTPYGNYGLDLTSSGTTPINSHTGRVFGERTNFWFGVTASYTF